MSRERFSQGSKEVLLNIESIELTLEERTAVEAAMLVGNDDLEREILFSTDIYRKSGAFRVREITGRTIDKVVNMRDRALTDDRFTEKWNNFNLLITRPEILRVAKLKGAKKNLAQIKEETGLTFGKIDLISEYLIANGIIEPSHQKRTMGKPIRPLDSKSLLDKLDKQDPDEIFYQKVKNYIEVHKSLRPQITVNELVKIISATLNKQVTRQQIQRQIRILIRDGLVSSNAPIVDRDAQMKKLIAVMEDPRFIDEDGNIVLSRVLKFGEITSDFRTLLSLYNERAAQSEVPPRKTK